MWMLPLYLHVNQISTDDDDDKVKSDKWNNEPTEEQSKGNMFVGCIIMTLRPV